MLIYRLKVDGMMCGMCEAHTNDAIRREFNVRKVTSSYRKGETVIITEEEIDVELLKRTIRSLGYEIGEISKETYKKKHFFGR